MGGLRWDTSRSRLYVDMNRLGMVVSVQRGQKGCVRCVTKVCRQRELTGCVNVNW